MNTLAQIKMAWAETYRGNGRLTGRLWTEPTRMENGDVAPGWTYVGNLTMEQYNNQFEQEQHDDCHTSSRPDWACPHCVKAGWTKEEEQP